MDEVSGATLGMSHFKVQINETSAKPAGDEVCRIHYVTLCCAVLHSISESALHQTRL